MSGWRASRAFRWKPSAAAADAVGPEVTSRHVTKARSDCRRCSGRAASSLRRRSCARSLPPTGSCSSTVARLYDDAIEFLDMLSMPRRPVGLREQLRREHPSAPTAPRPRRARRLQSSSRARSGCAKPSAQIYLRALDSSAWRRTGRCSSTIRSQYCEGAGGPRDRHRPDRPRRPTLLAAAGRGRGSCGRCWISTGTSSSLGSVQFSPDASRRRRHRPDHGLVPALDPATGQGRRAVRDGRGVHRSRRDRARAVLERHGSRRAASRARRIESRSGAAPRTRVRSPTTRSCTESSSTVVPDSGS